MDNGIYITSKDGLKVLGKTANGNSAHKCENKYLIYISENIV